MSGPRWDVPVSTGFLDAGETETAVVKVGWTPPRCPISLYAADGARNERDGFDKPSWYPAFPVPVATLEAGDTHTLIGRVWAEVPDGAQATLPSLLMAGLTFTPLAQRELLRKVELAARAGASPRILEQAYNTLPEASMELAAYLYLRDAAQARAKAAA